MPKNATRHTRRWWVRHFIDRLRHPLGKSELTQFGYAIGLLPPKPAGRDYFGEAMMTLLESR